MKTLKRVAWILTAVVLVYAGREKLAADRLGERAAHPAAGRHVAARPEKRADVGGFFDARISTGPAPTTSPRDQWIDFALGTVAPAAASAPPPRTPATTTPQKDGAAPSAPTPSLFHWLDTHSNPSVVKQGVGGKAVARRGAGVLIDSNNRRWEIDPPRSTGTVTGSTSAIVDSAEDSAVPEEVVPPVDPAEIARRKDDSLLALKCAGAAAFALLIW